MNKYNARKQEIDGHVFDSQGEAARYWELKMLRRAGEILDLKVHPKFDLIEPMVRGKKKLSAARYTADFSYIEKKTGWIVVEDFKGVKTEAFQLRKKLFLKRYPHHCFRITTAKGVVEEWPPG